MRILVTGNGGSGKSWLAQQLAGRLAPPLVQTDNAFGSRRSLPTPDVTWRRLG